MKWITASYGDDLWDIHYDDSVMTSGTCRLVGCRQRTPTSATKADTDGDGYWDGWIGVYGVGRSDNVILYMEHLQTGNGVEGDEIVQEQTGVHQVDTDDPGAYIQAVPTKSTPNPDQSKKYHSNVHPGELHWDANGLQGDPTDSGVRPDPTLEVETDFVATPGWSNTHDGDPSAIRNTNGVNVLTAISYNYRLYGIDVVFDSHTEKIERSELRDVCKGSYNDEIDAYAKECYYSDDWEKVNITPHSFNRYELGVIENKYHDDESQLHMLWATDLGSDKPQTPIDDALSYGNSTGIAWHTGSPNAGLVSLVERDFGIMIARDSFRSSQFKDLQSVGMHELGHALSIGWRDDAPIPRDVADRVVSKGYEVYSGNQRQPSLAGGTDPTLENISLKTGNTPRWTIMKRGYAPNSKIFTNTSADFSVLLFSIEELTTADFNHIPSKEK